MITPNRESYVFDQTCKFCAKDSDSFAPKVNVSVCDDCFSWLSNEVGLLNVGIANTNE